MFKRLPEDKLIVFFDGSCVLCNKFVNFILKKLGNKDCFLFCHQSHPLFQEVLNLHKINPKGLNSIVVKYKNEVYFQIQAIILILKHLPKPWSFLSPFLRVCPSFLASLAYKSVANNRHKLNVQFKESCPILPEKWKKLFISNRYESSAQKNDPEML